MAVKRRGLPRLTAAGDVVRWANLVVSQLNAEQMRPRARRVAWSTFVISQAPTRGNNDSSAAINNALVRAREEFYPCYIPAGSWRCANIRVPSQVELFGEGHATRLISTGADAPVLASTNWYSDSGAVPEGYTFIHDLQIEGSDDQDLINQHLVIVRDFFSRLENLILLQAAERHPSYRTEQRRDHGRVYAGQ